MKITNYINYTLRKYIINKYESAYRNSRHIKHGAKAVRERQG